jgi:hypothetical protein
MKTRVSLTVAIFITVLSQAACRPYVTSYRHVCFREAKGLEVLERSATSLDSQDKPLLFAKVGLPTKARLTRPLYTVAIDTPLNDIPVVFMKISTLTEKQIHIDGVNLNRISVASAMGSEGYQYSFDVERAAGRPLAFTVMDAAGNTLGTETVEYTIQSRGVAYGVEGT